MEKVLEQVLRNGKIQLTKVCNAPVNIGKTPALVFLEQLKNLGTRL